MQMQQQQQHQQGGGGGGGGPNAPGPMYEDDFVGLRPRGVGLRGGWGRFIGLKGGSPITNTPSTASNVPGAPSMVNNTRMPMAVVTTEPLITNLPQQQQQQQMQPQAIVGTVMNAPS